MTIDNILEMLKVDLGISTDAYDERLESIISYAISEIEREGIVLGDTIEEQNLVAMYAGWLWRKRETGEGMPRMVRYALNNKLFSQKMKVESDG
jgi:hypothetical protein